MRALNTVKVRAVVAAVVVWTDSAEWRPRNSRARRLASLRRMVSKVVLPAFGIRLKNTTCWFGFGRGKPPVVVLVPTVVELPLQSTATHATSMTHSGCTLTRALFRIESTAVYREHQA